MRLLRSPWLWATLAAGVVAVACAGGGLAVVNHLEAQRGFCVSCHLPDGTPLHQRKLDLALQQPGLDLVGVHFQHAEHGRFSCADCHRGKGWRDRTRVLWAAAGDTLQYVFASYHEPQSLTLPMVDRVCTSCHRDVTRKGNPQRFHGLLAHLDQTTVHCTACHVAHARWDAPGKEAVYVTHTAREVCGRCHKGDPPSVLVQTVLNAYRTSLEQRMERPPLAAAR